MCSFPYFRASLAVAGVGAMLALAGCKPSVPQADAAGPAPVPEVAVLTVQARPVHLVTELPGRTTAYQVSHVRPQVNGIVKLRLFEEGADVAEGQVLYEIDDAVYAASLHAAKADVAKAQANLREAQVSADRHRELVKIKAVSVQANDSAQAQLLQARAELASAEAALQMAQIRLDDTRITAPISGRIGQSSITPGALLSANQAEPLTTIQQLDPIYVDVTQSSVDMLRLRQAFESGNLRRGDTGRAPVTLILEDGRPYAHVGELTFSDARVDPDTGMVTLRAVFPNPDATLLPGMYVRAHLQEGVKDEAILLPQRAVTRNPRGDAVVLVLAPDGTVEQRIIETARTVATDWLVDSGIEAGEQLIVEGLQKVRPGGKAQAVAWAPEDGSDDASEKTLAAAGAAAGGEHR